MYFSDLTTAAKPRAIADYDYDKKLNSQYDEDYAGDFSKVGNEPAAAQQAPVTKVQLFEDVSSKKTTQRTTLATSTSSTSTTPTTDRTQDLELTKIPTSTSRSSLPTSSSTSTSREQFYKTSFPMASKICQNFHLDIWLMSFHLPKLSPNEYVNFTCSHKLQTERWTLVSLKFVSMWVSAIAIHVWITVGNAPDD